MPNPFDVGSAKYLASLGFPALATHERRHGVRGGTRRTAASARAYALKHIGELAAATDLPLNADFEAGFARDAEGVHESARLCVGAGVAGFSIEDYTGDPAARRSIALSEAVERLRAARAAIDASGEKVLLDRAQRGDPASRPAAFPRRCGVSPLMRKPAPMCFTRPY